MGDKNNQKGTNYFKGLMKKAQEAIKVVIGDSDAYSKEDSGGDLKFDPAIMMKINVTFDKEFLPKERVVKLNMRGKHFFHNLKRNLRDINGIYIVYPRVYEMQFEVRMDEWEKHLIQELNAEYQLDLKKIHFVSEEDICRKYQRMGITNIQDPYHLQEGELLIVAGGFINFDLDGQPLCTVKANLTKETKEKTGKARDSQETNYYNKYSPRAGAFFYVGGEWYHNLFIPELYHPEEPRFFYFRIADDNKNLKFFSDQKIRGIDIRSDEKTITTPDTEKVVYTINPAYLPDCGIVDFKLTITYDLEDIAEDEAEEVHEPEPKPEPIKSDTLPVEKKPEVDTSAPGQEEKAPTPQDQAKSAIEPQTPEVREINRPPEQGIPPIPPVEEADEGLPYLENEMILLPSPKPDDIPSYIMTYGSENKNIRFYTDSIDKEISISTPDRDEEIYKGKIGEAVKFSVKMGSIHYSVTDTFMSRLDDKELKLYFGWEITSNVKEKIYLKKDFYIIGREPLEDLPRQIRTDSGDQLIRLNKGDEDFWRIGASRDHALLLKTDSNYVLYNISLSYPVYLLKPWELAKPMVQLSRLEPVTDTDAQEKLTALLAETRIALAENREESLSEIIPDSLSNFIDSVPLENNDLVIIGNKVFKFIVPVVMESHLSVRIQKSILRKLRYNESVLRK